MCIATTTPSRTKHILKSSYLNWCGLFLWVIIMTIQSVDLKVPGGDTPRSAFTKINANFSNTAHAASRLVGVEPSAVPLVKDLHEASLSYVPGTFASQNDGLDIPTGKSALVRSYELSAGGTAREKLGITNGNPYVFVTTQRYSNIGTESRFIQFASIGGIAEAAPPSFIMRGVAKSGNDTTATGWAKFYTDLNTTLDGNGALKPSSPVLRVFADHITGNDDGERMAATYTKNGVGDYTISSTTGLRTDGWYVVIPNDMNGNPKVAITLDDTDGVITLRSYVRIFDMSTFKFVPDLEQPLDIPEGRWIDLRFNDLLIDESVDMPAQQPSN